MRRRRTYDQHCPVARSLDLLGERWTLLMVRDLFGGPLRFSELRRRFPALAPNLLADRLRFLVDEGIIRRTAPPAPAAYELSPRGRALRPVITELARWGLELLDDPDETPFPDHLLPGAIVSMTRPEVLDRRAWDATVALGDAVVTVAVAAPRRGGRPLDRLRVRFVSDDDTAEGERATTLDVRTTPGALLMRRVDDVHIDGPPWAADRFAALFGLDTRAAARS
jgi:DNA-binding HxlR family transcriptional regulator